VNAQIPGLILQVGLLLALVGCASGNKQPARAPAPVDEGIVEVHLLSLPMALNLDPLPGADGFAVKVYAIHRGRPKPAPITRGRFEILMYDGVLTSANLATAKPLRTWSYSTEELKEFAVQASIGTGYEMVLRWDEAQPRQDRITILARHVPPKGPPLFSAPSTLSVTGR